MAIPTFEGAVDEHFEDVHPISAFDSLDEARIDLVRLANHHVDELLRSNDWLLSSDL